MSTTINGIYTKSVVPNQPGGHVFDKVTITTTGKVLPAVGYQFGIWMVYNAGYPAGPYVTNFGTVQAPVESQGAYLNRGILFNETTGSIIGGAGTVTGGFGDPADGNIGVLLSSSGEVRNSGKISGGAGANGGGGGGGVYEMGGTVDNYSGGLVIGGAGGLGGAGGFGMMVDLGTTDNFGIVRGGNAGGGSSLNGSYGGAGVVLSAFNDVSAPFFVNFGQIIGGSGAIGGTGAELSALFSHEPGVNFDNQGTIAGGQGSSIGGTGLQIASYATAGAISNFGTVIGGNGNIAGGAGVLSTGPQFLTNSGKIIGGNSSGEYNYGADGVSLAGGSVNNSGQIFGGSGHYYGGPGIYIKNAGTVIDSGTITGGAGPRSNGFAVQFESGASRLILDHGADLIGGADANAASTNVIEFGAGTGSLGGIGTLFNNTTREAGITGFSSFAFDSGAAWTLAGTATGFAGAQISGFTSTDTLDISGLAVSQPETVILGPTDVLAIPESGVGMLDLTFSGDIGAHFTLGPDGHGGTDISIVPCFCAGTRIRTPSGQAAVETLKIGDLVQDIDGRAVPIRWIGTRVIASRFGDPLRVLPIRIQAGALGENIPARDLLVSPDHAMFLDGKLIQAGALVNFSSITREANIPETFTYYHIETAEHSLILAEDAPAETFIDCVDRLAFDNWAEHETLYGDSPGIAELPYPRAKSARQLPSSLKRFLAARAAALNGAALSAKYIALT